jgi:hypothetical protein
VVVAGAAVVDVEEGGAADVDDTAASVDGGGADVDEGAVSPPHAATIVAMARSPITFRIAQRYGVLPFIWWI